MIRIRMTEILGDIGDAQATDALIGLLDRDPDPLVQGKAVKALGKIKDRKALEALQAASRSREVLVQKAAAWALRQF